MAILGVEFNDTLLVASDGRQLLFAEPGCATLESGKAIFGAEARRTACTQPGTYHDRYWHDLSERRLARGTTEFETLADLAYGQMRKLWQACSDGITEVGFAVPAYWSQEQLALLLGISDEVGIPLTALVEIPVAATRREYPGTELMHIDVTAHATTISQMTQHGGVAVERSEVITGLGAVALERSCAEYFADRFLACSRFDPLHAAESEQAVYAQLSSWLDLLSRNAEAELQFKYKGNEFSAGINRANLGQRLQRRMQPLIQLLRARLQADRPAALQLNSGAAAFPGFVEVLAELAGCAVYVLEPGAAARGLVQRQAHVPRAATALNICTTLPWDQSPAESDNGRTNAQPVTLKPSHVVLGSRAWRLEDKVLLIGSEAAAGENSIVIDARHAGVSRRHCSIEASAGRIVLNDHSRFGTRLNGLKLQGSAVLQPGDVISLGEPACELLLVAEQ